MTWTDERVDSLKSMWADGLSCSQIAGEMGGITRNAVIGKVHRLGLPSRGKGESIMRTPRPKPKHRPQKHEKWKPHVRLTNHGNRFDMVEVNTPDPLPVMADTPPPHAVTLLELENHHCRFPYGEGAATVFCGSPTADFNNRIVYCAGHARIAYQPPQRRRAA